MEMNVGIIFQYYVKKSRSLNAIWSGDPSNNWFKDTYMCDDKVQLEILKKYAHNFNILVLIYM